MNEKQKIMSIVNICNAIDLNNKKNSKYWIDKIKEICEECLK